MNYLPVELGVNVHVAMMVVGKQTQRSTDYALPLMRGKLQVTTIAFMQAKAMTLYPKGYARVRDPSTAS